MSSTDRQNKLLLAEDWKRIYQSFKNADFKSYDFDNLRRTMISYLRTNYPEDFNDYIESSEYLALIDMIAFLGQNLSFRTDLNARENFIELAERRESVLRMARLVSYNPKRTNAANGLLKFDSVQTTENVRDSNGNSLSGRTITWNDTVNSDWYEQFVKILNAAFDPQHPVGKPVSAENVYGIPTEQYTVNSIIDGNLPVYNFSKTVNNQSLDFEVVSTAIDGDEIVEQAPNPLNQLSLLYRDNGQGPSSTSSGFFLHFRQGVLNRSDVNIDAPVPNLRVDVDAANINQDDVWMYELSSNGLENELWTKVEAVEGNNIVYNSLNKNIRNVYSVLTRNEDRVTLIFSDGTFGNLPKGPYRIYYRTSANRDYTILPSNLTNISIRIPYTSAIGRTETLTITLSLKEAVTNATSSESTESIQNNAPSTYYTQNRLVTAEDYNIGPLAVSQDIVKVKSVNRTASGISRYFDLLDPTGKYSKTNIFSKDGVIYKDSKKEETTFSFISKTDIESVIENDLTAIFKKASVRNFYLDNFPKQLYLELNLRWEQTTEETNRSTGYIKDDNGIIYQVGSFTEGSLRYLEPDSMIRFLPPAGSYFVGNGELTTDPNAFGAKDYMWTKVITVGDSINVTGIRGPIVFNDIVPNGCTLDKIQPKFVTEINDTVKTEMIDKIFSYKTFGLRYDQTSREWDIIEQDNLNVIDNFSLGLSGDETNQQLDTSWLVLLETDGINYYVTYRNTNYYFESESEVRFYFDSNKKVYDSKSNSIIKDKITILNINNNLPSAVPTSAYTVDFDWEITKEYRNIEGYVDSRRVEISLIDSDDDGVVDDLEIFEKIVVPNNYIFIKTIVESNYEYEKYVSASEENILVQTPSTFVAGDPIFYDQDENAFYKLDSSTRTLTQIYNYKAYVGRDKLKYEYVHASDENTRIDPSVSNIIDSYILTRSYDTAFRLYLNNTLPTKPLPLSTDALYRAYGKELNKIKSISDEIIYQPAKYKILFGSKADSELQATFKVVKNTELVISDNQLKSNIISAINNFFALENWDFGETFYWSELSTYIMQQTSPELSSITIVPKSSNFSFGSLMEIKSEIDEILISGATVDDIEIISAITTDRLRASGNVANSTTTVNTGIQSSTGSTSTGGGFTY